MKKTSNAKLLRNIAKQILLLEGKPMHYKEIGKIAESKGLLRTMNGKHLIEDVGWYIRQDIRDNGHRAGFAKFGKGIFGLIGWAKDYGINIDEIMQKYKKRQIKHRFDKYGFTEITDYVMVKRLKDEMRQIKSYLNGVSILETSHENICFWVWLCYKFDMYREATMLFRKISEDLIEKSLYKATEKIALACEAKLRST